MINDETTWCKSWTDTLNSRARFSSTWRDGDSGSLVRFESKYSNLLSQNPPCLTWLWRFCGHFLSNLCVFMLCVRWTQSKHITALVCFVPSGRSSLNPNRILSLFWEIFLPLCLWSVISDFSWSSSLQARTNVLFTSWNWNMYHYELDSCVLCHPCDSGVDASLWFNRGKDSSFNLFFVVSNATHPFPIQTLVCSPWNRSGGEGW